MATRHMIYAENIECSMNAALGRWTFGKYCFRGVLENERFVQMTEMRICKHLVILSEKKQPKSIALRRC